MLALHTRLRRKDDDIVAKVMDGEAVIINLSTGIYYSSDHVGAAMWELIEKRYSLDEVAAAIAARYDVPRALVQDDVVSLGGELLQHELVVVATEEPQEPVRSAPASAGADKLPYKSPQLQVYTDMEDLLALDPPTPGFADIPWKE
jgi:coenzyme PQQ synthesis protein D (PqqD)